MPTRMAIIKKITSVGEVKKLEHSLTLLVRMQNWAVTLGNSLADP